MIRRRTRAAGPGGTVALLLAGTLVGCSDLGEPLRPDESPGPGASSGADVAELVPARTVVGDSVVVIGSGFGDEEAGASFGFSDDSGGTVTAPVLSWSDVEIVVQVPPGAAEGATRFERDGEAVSGPRFETAPRRITYSGDLVPLFERWGCASCHGGSGNLFVHPWSALLAGTSDHGPAVIPRRSGESLLVQRLLPTTPVSERMPQGGAYLDLDTIRIFADWIDQGARND